MKRVSLLLMLVALVVVVIAVGLSYGLGNCVPPFASPGNPYPCGYCTWWAFHRARELSGNWGTSLAGLGHAGDWDDNAPQELDVGDTPYPGSIFVREAIDATNPCNDDFWDGCGHVAVVEEVRRTNDHQGYQFWVSEMNWGSGHFNQKTNSGWLDVNSRVTDVHFIYPPSDHPVPLYPNDIRLDCPGDYQLKWYGNFNDYTIYITPWYIGGDGRDGIDQVFRTQNEYLDMHFEDPVLIGWKVCGDRDGQEICGDETAFYAANCETLNSAGLNSEEDYCSPEYNATPMPTATMYPGYDQPPTVTPTPTPTPTSEPPPDRSQCQDESKTGVYLYKDANYEGSCVFFVNDHPNLGDTPVGDNGASSIRINGEYSVKLYGDINYGGPYEEVNTSETDLGWRSLGNQFSSIKLHETQHCSDESLPGVYLYSGRNYGGDCTYFVANHPNLGDTVVGDNATASIRINGEYTAWLYQDTDYGGLYDEIGVSETDLSWRSLYGQYSSIRLSVLEHCSDETQPGIYLYSTSNYGGSCKYYIEDSPDLDLMPISIRILGAFWARIYGETNYEGPYEEFHESEASMDWRSLGRNWHSMEVMVDATPPDTSITSGPSGIIPIGSATFTWTGSDNRTSTAELEYRYRLIGLSNDWSSWSHDTSVTYNDLTDGDYTFGVKARDVAHNMDPSPASRSFGVDVTPPETTITGGPNGCVGTIDVTFTWTGSDNRTPTGDLLYSYKLEGFDDWSAWTGATSKGYTGLPDGDYTFKVKAQDGVGHEDPSPAPRSFRVDTTPPTGSVLINGGDSATNKITVHVDVTGDDGPVGCGVTEMRLSNDGFNWEAWEPFATEGGWLLPTLNRTTWTVHVQLKDLVGNVSGAFTDDIYLDLYPPRPSSESYQLGARVVASADPTSESESYGLLSATMGQPIADGRMQSADYRLESGYQGAWPSVPRGRLPPESYDINPSVMASSGGHQASESYWLWGTGGQPADHDQPNSENYQMLSGYWGSQSAPCRLFADLDSDGDVDVADIMLVASRWRMTSDDPEWESRYDLNGDGIITVVDIMLVAAHWGETC